MFLCYISYLPAITVLRYSNCNIAVVAPPPLCFLPHSHVQISNESAIHFYQKFGFEIIETKKNYYKRIEPADAHVLQKSLRSPCAAPGGELQKAE